MKQELEAVEQLMTRLLNANNKGALTEEQIPKFGRWLKQVLVRQWISQWNKKEPHQGSGLRRLFSKEGIISHCLVYACEYSDIYERALSHALPMNFCIWVNPGQVLYRLGQGPKMEVYKDPTMDHDDLM